MNYKSRNTLLLILIALSFIPGLVLLRFEDLDGGIRSIVFFARLGAVSGLILLMWEMLLGSRSLLSKITPDIMWAYGLHKYIGKYATLLIIFHPVLYVIYFWAEFKVNILEYDPSRQFSVAIWIGILATVILLLIWITSVTLRKRLGFRKWHLTHILTYLVIPTVLVHTILISNSKLGLQFWYTFSFIYFSILLYQILFHLDVLRVKYKIVGIHNIADNTFEISLTPTDNRFLTPQPGQFVYLKHRLVSETHPFSISAYDKNSHSITVAIRDLGPFSHLLETAQVDDEISLDGPYGVFSREAFETDQPIVLLAGGVGCSPLMPIISKLEAGWKKEIYLFFGNREEKDIPYKTRLDEAAAKYSNFHLINVLEKTESERFEKGYITSEILKKYLKETLPTYKFFICGPPPMMNSMQKILLSEGVNKDSAHFERFV